MSTGGGERGKKTKKKKIQHKGANYNVVPTQQSLFFVPPPAVLSVPGKIFCLTGSGSGSVLLLFTIHIYEAVDGPQGLFIMMVCRPAYGWNGSTVGCVSIWHSGAGNPSPRYLTFRQRQHVKRLQKITTNASDRSFD